MTARELPPAIDAQEGLWDLPDIGEVLYYHRPGTGRPVLLLHSINAAPSAFEVEPFFSAMDLDRPLYAPDLPGFGRSVRADRPYTPEFFAAAIAAIIDAIGASDVDVIALSTTCEFAARAALAPDGRIRSLVMVSPTGLGRRRDEPSEAGPKVHSFFRTPGVGSTIYSLLRSRVSIRFFLNMAFKDRAPAAMVDYAYATTRMPGASYAPFYFLSGQMFAHDAVGDLYLPLEQPVLVLYDEDPNISFDHLDEVLSARSNWQARRVPGTRGLPHFEKAGETQAAILEFWTKNI